ncbi:MAG: GNAT family N-acetyltransferase [Clostridiales bacterium]|nr:GNAT family N-acetyltransferase [Clostridiales bacterium]
MKIELIAIDTDRRAHAELLLLADPSMEMVDKYLDAGEMYALVEGGEVLSEAVLLALPTGEVELKNLATRPDRQGRGLGSALVRALINRCAGRYSAMLVGTSQTGRPFYERLGFTYLRTEYGFFSRYPEPVWEDGAPLRDMIYLSRTL